MIKLMGLKKLEDKLRSIAYGVPVSAKQEIEQAAKNVVEAAKRDAPKRTGALANSIDYTLTKGGFNARIDVGVEYGVFVEFGTSRMRAQPYLMPNFRIESAKLPEKLRKRLTAVLTN